MTDDATTHDPQSAEMIERLSAENRKLTDSNIRLTRDLKSARTDALLLKSEIADLALKVNAVRLRAKVAEQYGKSFAEQFAQAVSALPTKAKRKETGRGR